MSDTPHNIRNVHNYTRPVRWLTESHDAYRDRRYASDQAPTLSADKANGGILVTWPDGDTFEFHGHGWSIHAVTAGIREHEAQRANRCPCCGKPRDD